MRFFINFLLLVCCFFSDAQAGTPVDITNVFNPARIKENSYKLILYNQNNDTLSNIGILDRQIFRENYNSIQCIKISEIYTGGASKNKTIVYVDAKTMGPQYFESSSNDTLIQKIIFQNGKMVIHDIKNGAEKVSEAAISSKAFLSNCFSELIQSNDFGKTPIIRFETFSPGKPANNFIAERVDEKEFSMLPSKDIACWVLKFTRIDSNGNKILAGFRYIDKVSGKVLMYKSDIGTVTFFSYQILFLQ